MTARPLWLPCVTSRDYGLDVDGQNVTTQRERVATGVAPYAIDVSGDGQWAVVGNVGLPGLANAGKLLATRIRSR